MKTAQVFTVIVLLLAFGQLHATIVNGGRGLPHARAAYTTRQGDLTAMGNVRFWGKKSVYENELLDIETGSMIWVVQGLTNFTYGFSTHGEISVSPIFYQDAHKLEGDEMPWDTFMHLKFGNYKVENQPVWVGLELGSRFATGENHNIIFEDYTAGKFEFGATGLITYRYSSPNLQNDFRVHANLGYWNHNDEGVFLTADPTDPRGQVLKMSQSFRYATGIEFPTKIYEYGLEVYGLMWVTRPPVAAASRENYVFMNVSFVYKPHPRFSFFTNSDLRLSSGLDTTEGLVPELPGMPNYPGWRINLGMRYQVLPTSVYERHKAAIERQQNAKTRQLYTQLEEEIAKVKKAREELDRLKNAKTQSAQETAPDAKSH